MHTWAAENYPIISDAYNSNFETNCWVFVNVIVQLLADNFQANFFIFLLMAVMFFVVRVMI